MSTDQPTHHTKSTTSATQSASKQNKKNNAFSGNSAQTLNSCTLWESTPNTLSYVLSKNANRWNLSSKKILVAYLEKKTSFIFIYKRQDLTDHTNNPHKNSPSCSKLIFMEPNASKGDRNFPGIGSQ